MSPAERTRLRTQFLARLAYDAISQGRPWIEAALAASREAVAITIAAEHYAEHKTPLTPTEREMLAAGIAWFLRDDWTPRDIEAVCSNCDQYQHPGQGGFDCSNNCRARGFAGFAPNVEPAR